MSRTVTAPRNRPRRLLTQNRELKAIGVWNWTLPAWAGRLPDVRVCAIDDTLMLAGGLVTASFCKLSGTEVAG